VLGTTGGIAIVAYETGSGEAAHAAKPSAGAKPAAGARTEESAEPLIWARYTTPDGWCSVEFPTPWDLKEETSHIMNASFLCATAGIRSARSDDIQAAFILLVIDAPIEFGPFTDEGLRGYFRNSALRDHFRNPVLRDIGENRHTQQNIVVEGCPGWEFDSGPHTGIATRIKLVVRDGKVYEILALTAFPAQYGGALQRFINSFRFEKPKP
jgi:hypothetical protein